VGDHLAVRAAAWRAGVQRKAGARGHGDRHRDGFVILPRRRVIEHFFASIIAGRIWFDLTMSALSRHPRRGIKR
jgi:hypothetical protein